MKKEKLRKPKKYGSALKKILFFILFLFMLTLTLSGAAHIYMINYTPSIGYHEIPFETLDPSMPAGEDIPIGEGYVPDVSGGKYAKRIENFYTFLIVGKDKVGMNTDVIMLISFNTATGRIAVMQIPRDTYIEVYGVSHKLNSVFAACYNDAKRNKANDPTEAGMKEFVSVLQKNLNVKIDYYAMMYLDGFKNIVDIIGGVPMNIPFRMYYDDPDQGLHIDLYPGEQVLNGAKAEQFVRYRSGYIEGDVGRVDAQKLFITAMMKQIETNLTLAKIPQLAAEGIKNVSTSAPIGDIVYFGKAILKTDMSDITMFTMPGTDARANGDSGAWYYVMYRADTLKLINRYFNVYTDDITNDIFDIKHAFTDVCRPHINNIYNTESGAEIDDLVTSADKVDKDGIKIPLLK